MSFVTTVLLSAHLTCVLAYDSTADSVRLRADLSRALTDLAATEYVVAQKMSASATHDRSSKTAPVSPVTDAERLRHTEAIARAHALLDTIVLQRSWGGNLLERLRAEYPGSVLLDRFDAALLAKNENDSAAVVRYTGLLRKTPEDPELHIARAVLLQRMGEHREAQLAYERAFELDPTDTTAYAALLQQHDRSGTLNMLLRQVRRLRVRNPDSSILLDREIELLHRLGQLKEAAELAGKEQ